MRTIAAAIMFAAVTVLTGAVHATTLTLDLDPSLIGGQMLPTGSYEVSTSALNGTPLNGQQMSLDLVFADNIIARVLNSDPQQTGMVLDVITNVGFSCQVFPGFGLLCGHWTGFPTAQTGYFQAPNGSALNAPVDDGCGMGSNGSFCAGVIANIGGSYELSGVHMDFLTPVADAEVTSARLVFVTSGQYGTVQFGTAAQLPDGDSWVPVAGLLITLGLLWRRNHVLAGALGALFRVHGAP